MKTPTIFKSKRLGLTDYRKRLRILRSGKPRFVVRRSGKGVMVQLIKYKPEGDNVLVTVTDKSLKKMGLDVFGNSTPVSYLVGYAAGVKAKKLGETEAILDTGRYKFTKGGRLAAALKGFVDSGMEIPHDPEIFPSEERIRGKHLSSAKLKVGNFDELLSKIEVK